MKKIKQNKAYDNLIGQKLEETFGYSDEQLIAEYDCIAKEPFNPNEPVPMASEERFEKILNQLRGERTEKKQKIKVVRLKRVAKTMLIAAALCGVVMSSGIAVSGKKGYEYTLWKDNGRGGNSVWDNTGNLVAQNPEIDAYRRVHNELGIDVLRLTYMPEGMKYESLKVGESYVRLDFVYNDNYISFFQALREVDSSGNTKSDRVDLKLVRNRQIGVDMCVESNEIGNDLELSTEFVIGKAYYYLEGIMDEEEFLEMVERIDFFN